MGTEHIHEELSNWAGIDGSVLYSYKYDDLDRLDLQTQFRPDLAVNGNSGKLSRSTRPMTSPAT